jgi:superfamily II DNA helicase RecQ
MKFNFFSIPANNPEDAQRELNAFLNGHKIVTVEKNFVQDGMQSYWAICVSYLDHEKRTTVPGKNKVDYREVLDDKDFAVFVKLRTLRKTLADREGIPAYALFTNEQLACMVQGKVTTVSGLSEIDGVGKGRLDKYGKSFLGILKDEFAGESPAETSPPPVET